MALNYKIKATVNPAQGTSGNSVTMTASISEVEGEVASVYANVVGQGMQFKLMPKDDGTYSASSTIPWGAPPGVYEISVYAVDSERQRGPVASVKFSVV